VESVVTSAPDASYYEFKKYKDGILTIGTIGQPNTGKSSLINGLMGKKVICSA
jgi:ribosome biogenesis GTPase A